MAFVRAVKSGNWSDPTVWHTNALPTSGDTVYSNNFTVTIDQDVLIGDTNNTLVNAGSFIAGCAYQVIEIGSTNFGAVGGSNVVGIYFIATGSGTGTGIAKTIATLTNGSNTPAGAAAGGGFASSIGGTINSWLRVTTGTLLTLTGNNSFFITGTLKGGGGNIAIDNYITASIDIVGDFDGTVSTATLLRNNNVCNCNITGNLYGNSYSNTGTTFSNGPAITTITGDLDGTVGPSGAANAILSTDNGTVTLVGNIRGRLQSTNITYMIVVSGTLYVTGNIYAGVVRATISVNSGAILYIIGNVYANGASACFSSGFSAKVYFLGSSFDYALNGIKAFQVRALLNYGIPQTAVRQIAVDGTSTMVTYYTVDNDVFDYAAISDVRDGVSYANGNLVGTCKIPSPNNVTYNTSTDNTVGTAVLKPENVWDYLKNNIDTEGSIGERLKNAVTVNDMGKLLIDTLT